MKVEFRERELIVAFTRYTDNDNIAILLKESKNEPHAYAIASVNTEKVLRDGIVSIKDWSENAGMVEALIKGNIIKEEPVGFEASGFVNIPHFPLTDEAKEDFQKQWSEQNER